jgi:hydroxyacylglutathione hydrolase
MILQQFYLPSLGHASYLSGSEQTAAALFIIGAELPTRPEEVPRDRPVAVICGSGYRSSAMASLLQHRGHARVINIPGGMQGWRAADLETAQD